MAIAGPYGEDERAVLEMEEEIIKELEDAVTKVEKISEKEEEFLKHVESGTSPVEVEKQVVDSKRFLEDEVEPELRDVETKVKSLRDIIDDNNSMHLEILEHISNALGLIEKEEQRFQDILRKSVKYLEKAESGEEVKKIAQKVIEFEETEERQAMSKIEHEIKYAEHQYEEYLKSASK